MALGTCRRKEVVDVLLVAMNHKDASIRSLAASSLVNTLAALFPYLDFNLGQVGYSATSTDEPARNAAIEKIRNWWAEKGAE